MARRRRSRAAIVGITVLSAVLVVAVAALVWLAVTVVQLNGLVQEQSEQIRQQQEDISNLNDLLDEKQDFSAAVGEFLDSARALSDAPMATLVPSIELQQLASHAWTARRSPGAGSADAERVRALADTMRAAQAAADAERSSNATGTLSESILDEVGRGYARLSFDGADTLCEGDVVGCVSSGDPYVVHLDLENLSHPSMDDWARRLVTLHEFAHVLQFTNPEATAVAEQAFEGDWEFMADCYALRQMNEWTLKHRVWVSSFEYWDTQVGYGRVCDSAQRQVIGDWLTQVGANPPVLAS